MELVRRGNSDCGCIVTDLAYLWQIQPLHPSVDGQSVRCRDLACRCVRSKESVLVQEERPPPVGRGSGQIGDRIWSGRWGSNPRPSGRAFLRRPALTFSGVLSSPRESPLYPTLAAAHPTRLPIEIVLWNADAFARLPSSLPSAPCSASHSRGVRPGAGGGR